MGDAPAAADLLSDASLAALAASKPVEVVAGIHAANQAGRIQEILDTARVALEPAGSPPAAVLVIDAGSGDATPDVARGWCASTASVPGCYLETRPPRHRARALLALLRAAQQLGARATVLLDADLSGIPAGAVRALLEPVLRDEADYVSPAYSRTVSEGTLTTNLLAPLTRALYGAPLQQVMGGCAGLSGATVKTLLDQSGEGGGWQPFGAELWLTTAALVSGARIVEVGLGRKTVSPGSPAPDLATILVRTVGPQFALMERYQAVWQDRTDGVPVPRRGDPVQIHADARAPAVEQMVHAFNLGLKDLLPVWEQVMPESTLARLYPLSLLAADEFALSPALWARVVSDFAVAYHERRMPRDHLLRALTPLYLGRVAAVVVQARATTPERIPVIFETIDRAFEAEKEHLVARWR